MTICIARTRSKAPPQRINYRTQHVLCTPWAQRSSIKTQIVGLHATYCFMQHPAPHRKRGTSRDVTQDQGPGQGPGARTGRAPGNQRDTQGQAPRTEGPNPRGQGPTSKDTWSPTHAHGMRVRSNRLVHPCGQWQGTRTYNIGRTGSS